MIVVLNPHQQPGPTGDYPRGKMASNDEGGLNILFDAVMGDNNEPVIVMSFGTEVGWIGLEPEQVDGICEMLQMKKKQALELMQATEKTDTRPKE